MKESKQMERVVDRYPVLVYNSCCWPSFLLGVTADNRDTVACNKQFVCLLEK